MPPAPSPVHLLRQHRQPITALAIAHDNRRIYAGDSEGTVSITLTLTLRQVAHWKAHQSSILGVQPWADKLITDNKLLIWQSPEEVQTITTQATVDRTLPTPVLVHSLDVNTLNYCRFSLCEDLPSTSSSEPNEALIAIPNLLESSLVDIWRIPSCERPHASIGLASPDAPIPTDGRDEDGSNFESIDANSKTKGIVMSLHLYFASAIEGGNEEKRLHLLAGYESGALVLRRYTKDWGTPSLNGSCWETLWEMKEHRESIMAMTVSPTLRFALSTSSEHLLVRYPLVDFLDSTISPPELKQPTVFRTKWPGNGCIAIRPDGRVCAVGGWDGNIRLYSTKSGKSLGLLEYHRGSCQAVVFAHRRSVSGDANEGGEKGGGDDFEDRELNEMEKWLIAGGKDGRISIWKLIDFEKK